MSTFKMSRTNGTLLAIMNACIQRLELGHFMVQMNSSQPMARYTSDCTSHGTNGYTDTGECVTSEIWLKWHEGENPNMYEARISFGRHAEDLNLPTIWHTIKCEYSPAEGIIIKSITKDDD